jgi:hypothetical protein
MFAQIEQHGCSNRRIYGQGHPDEFLFALVDNVIVVVTTYYL